MSVQRNLPRPTDMNHSILRPADMIQPLSEYQKAEEMIKEELLLMLHHDALTDPSMNQYGIAPSVKKSINTSNLKPLNYEKHQSFLREKNYDTFTPDELQKVRFI